MTKNQFSLLMAWIIIAPHVPPVVGILLGSIFLLIAVVGWFSP